MIDENFTKIFHEMDVYLRSRSAYITFLQLRVASEFNIVWQCGWVIHNALPMLDIGKYHVRFEKKHSSGRQDLLLVPLNLEGLEDKNNALIFEFKLAWPGGIGECSKQIRDARHRLKGKSKAFVLGLLFAFEQTPSWTPYQPRKQDLDRLEREIYKKVECEPFVKGTPFPMISEEAKGKGRLVAWKPIFCEVS